MKRAVLTLSLTFTLLFSALAGMMLANLAYANFGTVQASTGISGIISSDTVWTKANSPYDLGGNVLVSNGVTLAIEPGVAVNLNGHYLMVNGTLVARGTSNNQVYFNAGQIIFTQYSSGWNEQTASGSIIENSKLNLPYSLLINDASPKIDNNYINATISITRGAPVISYNQIIGVANGGTIIIEGSYSVIFNNDITDRVRSGPAAYGISFYGGSNAYISHNTIHHGIGMLPGVGSEPGMPIIERNYVTGIDIRIPAIIRNNTIPYIHDPSPSSTIVYNNLQYLQLEAISTNINAANNWWGTTDTAAIDKSIYDFNDDFNLGKVNYNPFLTAPNPYAMPDPNAPIPIPNALPSPSTTPPTTTPPSTTSDQSTNQTTPQTGLNGIEIAILAVLVVIVVLLIITIGLVLKKKQ